jgi:hypothetical protein
VELSCSVKCEQKMCNKAQKSYRALDSWIIDCNFLKISKITLYSQSSQGGIYLYNCDFNLSSFLILFSRTIFSSGLADDILFLNTLISNCNLILSDVCFSFCATLVTIPWLTSSLFCLSCCPISAYAGLVSDSLWPFIVPRSLPFIFNGSADRNRKRQR